MKYQALTAFRVPRGARAASLIGCTFDPPPPPPLVSQAYKYPENSATLKELGVQSRALKAILGRIPEEINDR